ncbi:BREX-1 system phosphatase PglZ type A [Microbacterium sp. CFBP9034]|uniref:BREX-1 system phosphatase PglZ type A n=1 Tax=Microbacterium sp. CFBP9034 TaxID=3096540 RepID=UPI002A69D5A9|nr:BREX-1 system phosphatase PglZ type A [Microbacterium sp. CFBP9034]MDY0910082.1 BREX-1 system phosphatase PglZ type A [Microbacterium sp. CFBP9034]
MSDLGVLKNGLAERFASGRKAGDRHIAFWHDPEGEYEADLDQLEAELDGVEVIRVDRDEYAVKYRLLTEQPNQAFIVYRKGGIPDGIGNWLWDLELAYGVFTADRASMDAQDLGLPLSLQPVVAQHPKFFNSADRKAKLKGLLSAEDDRKMLRAKMSAVALGVKAHSFGELTRALLIENAAGSSNGYDALFSYGLTDFYWEGAKGIYGYESANPKVGDFVEWVFTHANADFGSARVGLRHDYSAWRNDVRSREAMAALARRVERDLGVEAQIADRHYDELLSSDAFEAIDWKIIGDLALGVSNQSLTVRDLQEAERARQTTFWYTLDPSIRALYTAIRSAAELLHDISTLSVAIADFDDGLSKYKDRWYRIDQRYRQFLLATHATEHADQLAPLVEQVELFYTNKYVFPLATEWQKQIDAVQSWKSVAYRPQGSFYQSFVDPIVSQGRRVVVVISDALRYEVADELASALRSDTKIAYDAKLDVILGALPSYTQLGMASLLPHTTIGFAGKGSDVVVDGKPAGGLVNRTKILDAIGGTAISAEDVLAKKIKDELRPYLQQHKIVYVYHDTIDKRSHKLGAESGTPEAARDAIAELTKLIGNLTSADANVLVTSDHGFLFQESKIGDGSKLDEEPHGDIKYRDRRFLLGEDFKQTASFNTYASSQLGLVGDWQVHIPKSIYRLTQKLQGAADRFVHGGATLQEVVVPVVTVTRKGKSGVRPVDVQIKPKSDVLTNAIVRISLLQSEPISERTHARELRAAFYYGDALISDQVVIVFAASGDERDRLQEVKLQIRPDAGVPLGAQVELRLEQPSANSNSWQVPYKHMFTNRITATPDF